MQRLFAVLLLLMLLPALWSDAQEADSLNFVRKSPLKAGILSAALPGGGQIYNQSYLKAGAVIAIEGLFLGYAIKNNQETQKYYGKWKASNSDLDYAMYEDYYEKRDSDIWWLGITIFLSTLDAVTDAYLHDFEYQKSKVRLKFEDHTLMLEYKFGGVL